MTLKSYWVPPYIKTAPTPSPDAPHSSTKGCMKFGSANTRQLLITCLRSSKASYTPSVHLNAPLVKSVRGATNWDKPFTHFV